MTTQDPNTSNKNKVAANSGAPATSAKSFVKFAIGLTAAEVILGSVAAAIVIWWGVITVAASAGHWQITNLTVHYAMERSVAYHAPKLKHPALDDAALIREGAAYYETGCAPCHGAPGKARSPIERGALPPPPLLTHVGRTFPPDELHWIIKHGIKLTPMPAWPTQKRNDGIWALVAFLEKMPSLTPAAYRKLAFGSLAPLDAMTEPHLSSLDRFPVFAATSCSSCHGVDGRGRGGAFPNIAGLNKNYIEHALQSFADGTRPSGFMEPVVFDLNKGLRKRFAAFYASLPRGKAPAATKPAKDIVLGARIASEGIGKAQACMSCHAAAINAHSSTIPPLTGQPARYLKAQLHLFRDGIRANTPNAEIMARIASHLSNVDIDAAADYFASLPSGSASEAQAKTQAKVPAKPDANAHG